MTGSDRLTAIADGLENKALQAVAAIVLGSAHANLAGRPKIAPLSAHHYDSRTLGLLHVTGQATDALGQLAAWSSVIKVLDLREPPRANNFVDAANEVLVYRDQLFATDGDPFRPAHCYRIDERPDGIVLLWLEDLTGMQKPPFTLEELEGMASHLASWNARRAIAPKLPLELPANSFLLRWSRNPATRQVSRLRELSGHRYMHDAYRDVPIEAFEAFLLAADRLNARTAHLAPSLCFGDCNIGNLFHADRETVAVDWASLTLDPLGADIGCLVGSAICWGRDGGAVAADEHDLFETYATALTAVAPQNTRADMRRAYFGQYGFYVCFCATMPALLIDEVFPVSLVEMRFGARADEIPGLVASVIAKLPIYTDELTRLAT